jgi:hypothetical protein
MLSISDLTEENDRCKILNINDDKLYIVSNVKTYDNKTPKTWDLELYDDNEIKKANNKPIITNSKFKIKNKNFVKIQYYFIIDTYQNEAFAHWVFESAVYLHLFTELKQKYPTIKLALRSPRTYKKLFLKLFNISTDDIVHNIEINNICIFPSPLSMINDKELNDKFQINARKLKETINKMFATEKQKDINILFMPRQSKENFFANNRVNDSTDIQQNLKSENIKHILLNTDDVTNIKIQIDTIKKAKNIIITDGSPFLVNGLFCKNANIIVLGDIVSQDGQTFKRYKFLKELIEEENKVTMLPYVHGTFYNCKFYYNDIKNLLE